MAVTMGVLLAWSVWRPTMLCDSPWCPPPHPATQNDPALSGHAWSIRGTGRKPLWPQEWWRVSEDLWVSGRTWAFAPGRWEPVGLWLEKGWDLTHVLMDALYWPFIGSLLGAREGGTVLVQSGDDGSWT